MQHVTEWLNTNEGFAIILLTAVYVIATIVMARYMARANMLASKSLAQAVELERRRTRPHLSFDLESHRKFVYAVLRNIGKTAAYNVTIQVTPALEHSDKSAQRTLSLVTGSIRMIAPGREFSDLVDFGPKFFERYKEPRFRGCLMYHDAESNTYEDRFDIDMSFAAKLLYVEEPPDVGSELEKIRELLRQRL
jgi:hypothetical protein